MYIGTPLQSYKGRGSGRDPKGAGCRILVVDATAFHNSISNQDNTRASLSLFLLLIPIGMSGHFAQIPSRRFSHQYLMFCMIFTAILCREAGTIVPCKAGQTLPNWKVDKGAILGPVIKVKAPQLIATGPWQ